MKRPFVIGCLGLTAVGCLGSAALLVVASRGVDAVADAASVCDGAPRPLNPAYAPAGPHLVLGFVHDAGWRYGGSALPTSLARASSADEASLVFCMEPERIDVVETCAYEGGTLVTRRRHARDVRLVSARDATVLRAVGVAGTEPPPCPGSVTTGGGGGGVGIRVMGIPVASVGGGGAEPETELVGGAVGPAEIGAAFADLVH